MDGINGEITFFHLRYDKISNCIVQSTFTVEPSAAPYSYDDLFPALPESTQPKFPATNNKFRIGTIITQVMF